MSSLFDLIYSQQKPSEAQNDPPAESSRHNNTATPFPILKSHSQYDDSHSTTLASRTVRKQLSVQFVDQKKAHRPRSLMPDFDQYSSADETEQSTPEDDDSIDSNDSDRPKKPMVSADSKKHFRKFFTATPKVPANLLPLYQGSPELCNKEITHFEGRPKYYCPNELAFIRFPQSEQSVLATQRKLVRAVWLQCYHSKDFEGALMALQVLAAIDTIDFPDLEKLVAIVTTSSTNVIELLQNLVRKAKKDEKHAILRGHGSLRASMIGLFAQTFLAQGSAFEARQVFKQYSGDQAFSTSSLLLAYDSIITCQLGYDEICSLKEFIDIDEDFPTIEDIVVDPLNIYYVIKLLRLFSSRKENKFSRCENILREIANSFRISTSRSEPLEWIDFQFLHIAFQLGSGCSMAVVEESLNKIVKYHMEQILPHYPQLYQANMIKFYHLLTRLVYKFQHANSMDSLQKVHSLAIITKTLHLEYDQTSSDEEKVYFSWLLYSMALIEKETFIEVVSEFIETNCSHGGYLYDLPSTTDIQQMFTNSNQKTNCDRKFAEIYEIFPFDQSHWVAWKLMAVLLGPLDETMTVANDTPISIDSDIASFYPDLMVAAQKVKHLPSRNNVNRLPRETHKKSAVSKNKSNMPIVTPSVANTVEANAHNFKINFQEENRWWLDSILSATSLDSLSPTVVIGDYQDILNSLQNRFDEIESMYELDLRYLYQQTRVSKWERFDAMESALNGQYGNDNDEVLSVGVHEFPILFDDKDATSQNNTLVSNEEEADDESLLHRLTRGDIIKSFLGENAHSDGEDTKDVADEGKDENDSGDVFEHLTANTNMTQSNNNKVVIGSIELDLEKISDLLSAIKLTQSAMNSWSPTPTPLDGTAIREEEQLSREAACQLSEIRSFFLPNHPLAKDRETSMRQDSNEDESDKNENSSFISADSSRPLVQLFHQYTASSHETATQLDFAVLRVRRNLEKYFPDSHKLGFILRSRLQTEETVFLLGQRLLEIITYQALVSSHLAKSQDNLFLLRVTQILVLNAMIGYDNRHRECAIHCLAFLYFHNINLDRALYLATESAFARIDPSIPPKDIFVLPADQPIVVGNTKDLYQPIPFK